MPVGWRPPSSATTALTRGNPAHSRTASLQPPEPVRAPSRFALSSLSSTRLSVVAAFLLLSAVFWYPFVCSFVILDNQSSALTAFFAIGAYFVPFILFLAGVMWYAWTDPQLNTVDKEVARLERWTFANVLSVVSLLLDAYQLCSIGFVADLFPPYTGSNFFSVALLNYDLNTLPVTEAFYWIGIAVGLCWISLAAYLHYLLVTDKIPKIAKIPFSENVVPFLSVPTALTDPHHHCHFTSLIVCILRSFPRVM